ncbi:CPBP family intramembrane glutamic endopeptidase [Eilatimonas milleporae]|uniref:CAAX prenyl protease-like protein n=1 Tax=Eilatimonas milleporae TaxID=911205 RepID=A0A3M0BXR6_9PROT|nr:CPBP family intramembrane glutamic endopeptidase [Eilatimonas milleporae]RMB01832.1 CAAX prenyl protease-like protein [Eilatimonas milleporae]
MSDAIINQASIDAENMETQAHGQSVFWGGFKPLILWFVIEFALGFALGFAFGFVGADFQAVGPWNVTAIMTIVSGAGGVAAVSLWIGFDMGRHHPGRAHMIGWRPARDGIANTLFRVFLAFVVLRAAQAAYFAVFTEYTGAPAPSNVPATDGLWLPHAVWIYALLLVIAPVVEEAVFRGYLQNSLKSRLSPVLSMTITAALFASIHFDIANWVPLFFLGLALGAVRERTGALWPSMALHVVNNTVALVIIP